MFHIGIHRRYKHKCCMNITLCDNCFAKCEIILSCSLSINVKIQNRANSITLVDCRRNAV